MWTPQKSGRTCMFRCQACGNVVPPRVSVERIVVEMRPRLYPFRREVMRELVKNKVTGKLEHPDDRGGAGFEIVRELTVCPPCRRAFTLASAPRAPEDVDR